MFTIKNYGEESDYTAYEAPSYSVSWESVPQEATRVNPGILPVVTIYPATDGVPRVTPGMRILVHNHCYIENEAGKTIEHLRGPEEISSAVVGEIG